MGRAGPAGPAAYHRRVSVPVPVHLPEVLGPVLVRAPLVGRPTVTVGGQPVRRVSRGTYELPTRDGEGLLATVVPGARMSPYPRLLLETGEVHPTGPTPPLPLQVLGVLPGLVVLLGGASAFVAVLGLVASLLVLRRSWPPPAQYAAVLVVLGLAVGLGWTVSRVWGWV